MKYTALLVVGAALLFGCAAKGLLPGAEKVLITNEKPPDTCTFLGEVVGSQGNWWTDDVTSTKNKMVGARNEIRNEAFKRGANLVFVQEFRNTRSDLSFDVTNTTGIGNAYKCP
jgi:Domain of unknown function (DUF4156)